MYYVLICTGIYCDLHDNDMSRKKCYVFRCVLRDRLLCSSIGILHLKNRIFWGVGCGRAIGICVLWCGIEARFS